MNWLNGKEASSLRQIKSPIEIWLSLANLALIKHWRYVFNSVTATKHWICRGKTKDHAKLTLKLRLKYDKLEGLLLKLVIIICQPRLAKFGSYFRSGSRL